MYSFFWIIEFWVHYTNLSWYQRWALWRLWSVVERYFWLQCDPPNGTLPSIIYLDIKDQDCGGSGVKVDIWCWKIFLITMLIDQIEHCSVRPQIWGVWPRLIVTWIILASSSMPSIWLIRVKYKMLCEEIGTTIKGRASDL